jgi:hypothetical protein
MPNPKRFNGQQINLKIKRAFEGYRERIEAALLMRIKMAGELFITYAREKGSYTDHTGNLRSSIGYAILKDGHVIFESFPGLTSEGVSAGKKAIAEAIGKYSGHKGFALIGVAGMEYGIFVESKGKDVITGSSYATMALLKNSLRELQKNIKRA